MVGTGRQVEGGIAQTVSLVGVSAVAQQQLHDALIAIAGREMEGCPSLVIGCTGVDVILQELSDCVDVVAVGCLPQSFYSCGDKRFKVTGRYVNYAL